MCIPSHVFTSHVKSRKLEFCYVTWPFNLMRGIALYHRGYHGKQWVQFQFSWCLVMIRLFLIIFASFLTHYIRADNGLSPVRRQDITWTNADFLSIGSLGANFSEFLIEIYIFSSRKMHLIMSSGKWQPFCLGHNVLSVRWIVVITALWGWWKWHTWQKPSQYISSCIV